MNVIDLLVFLGALTIGVRGYRRGMVLEGLEAVSAFGGLALAYRLRHGMGAVAAITLGLPESLARGMVFIGAAVLVASIGFAVAGWLSRMVPGEGPWAAADGLGGLVFGAAKGMLYSALLLVLVAQIPAAFINEWTYGSVVCRAIFSLLPDLYQSLDGWV